MSANLCQPDHPRRDAFAPPRGRPEDRPVNISSGSVDGRTGTCDYIGEQVGLIVHSRAWRAHDIPINSRPKSRRRGVISTTADVSAVNADPQRSEKLTKINKTTGISERKESCRYRAIVLMRRVGKCRTLLPLAS